MDKKSFFSYFLALIFSIMFLTVVVKAYDKDEVLRLRVIPNSSSEEDQNVKYKIRDYLLDSFDFESKKDCLEYFSKNREKICQDIKEILLSNNVSYDFNIGLKAQYFCETHYDNGLVLESGNYDSLDIELGDGLGRNWWCVVFPKGCIMALPPNCFEMLDHGSILIGGCTKKSAKSEPIEGIFNGEEVIMIKKNEKYEIAFKSVEIFQENIIPAVKATVDVTVKVVEATVNAVKSVSGFIGGLFGKK